jgi:hypothetical protein
LSQQQALLLYQFQVYLDLVVPAGKAFNHPQLIQMELPMLAGVVGEAEEMAGGEAAEQAVQVATHSDCKVYPPQPILHKRLSRALQDNKAWDTVLVEAAGAGAAGFLYLAEQTLLEVLAVQDIQVSLS